MWLLVTNNFEVALSTVSFTDLKNPQEFYLSLGMQKTKIKAKTKLWWGDYCPWLRNTFEPVTQFFH